jgi:hypothetical protein
MIPIMDMDPSGILVEEDESDPDDDLSQVVTRPAVSRVPPLLSSGWDHELDPDQGRQALEWLDIAALD